MVNHPRRKINVNEEPPSLDESWWEAVLAEESEKVQPAGRSGSQPAANKLQPTDTGTFRTTIDWERAIQLFREDGTIKAQVSGYNRGGLLVNADNLQGFVPVSHLVALPANVSGEEQEQFLAAYMERWLNLKVIECDPRRGRVVLSERAALAEPGKRNNLLSQLHPGECIPGIVTNVAEFGVFVDLGGVEGLIHVSEISWGRVKHPGDVVKVGDKVQVYVIQVDPERSRIALSLKRLCKNPWESAEEHYYPGQVMEAVISSIVPFGAFARLEEGLDGLIHISEIKAAGIENPLSALAEGQQVQVRVLHIDAIKQRLGLSLQLDN